MRASKQARLPHTRLLTAPSPSSLFRWVVGLQDGVGTSTWLPPAWLADSTTPIGVRYLGCVNRALGTHHRQHQPSSSSSPTRPTLAYDFFPLSRPHDLFLPCPVSFSGMMTGVSNVGEPTNSLQVVFHVLVMACALVLFAYAIGVAAVIEAVSYTHLTLPTKA